MLLGMVAAPGAAHAASGAKSLDLVEAEVQPGIQQIQSTFSAHVVVQRSDFNSDALNSFEAQAAPGASDQTNFANLVVDEIDAHPLTYLQPGNIGTDSGDASVVGFGTGWVVSPDGYIVTADHVVDVNGDEVKSAFVQEALNSFVQDCAFRRKRPPVPIESGRSITWAVAPSVVRLNGCRWASPPGSQRVCQRSRQ
jgi:serine protease Do